MAGPWEMNVLFGKYLSLVVNFNRCFFTGGDPSLEQELVLSIQAAHLSSWSRQSWVNHMRSSKTMSLLGLVSSVEVWSVLCIIMLNSVPEG